MTADYEASALCAHEKFKRASARARATFTANFKFKAQMAAG
jgi:hypothetical protein